MFFLLIVVVVALVWWRVERDRQRAAPREPVEAPAREPQPGAAIGTFAGAYAVFAAWMFVAWYRKHRPLRQYQWGGDGWLGLDTYAGGADKFGHAWATMALARLGTQILHGWGGFALRKASLLSAGLSELLFTGVEVKDGVYYEFSFSDLTGDSIGAVIAPLLDNFPRLNELFGFRVEYVPSKMYRRKIAGRSPCPPGGCSRWNIAEDYSGETYLAAFHLAGLRTVRERIGDASRFFDLAAGFDSRHFKPTPDRDIKAPPRQDLFLGLAFNAQGFIDWLLADHPSPAAQRARQIAHGLFEVFQFPMGTLRVLQTRRTTTRHVFKNHP